MLSLRGRQYSLLTLLSLLSFLAIGLFLANTGGTYQRVPEAFFTRLDIRQDESSSSPSPPSSTVAKSNTTSGNSISPASGTNSNASISSLSAPVAPMGFTRQMVDDPYTCAAGRPCSNGACCPATGNCGYGPAYCGTGCISNCNAKAECGQFAATTGKTCPLNACCSEFGYCGTTLDFCKPGCQSNCILEPQPPAGSPKNAAMDRVIGYYETWSYRSKCNRKLPTDLPLKELTHLNYAFAFIKPGTYELTTMDKETTEDLWQLTVDTKKYNANLKVYVAVGGWTFSDNDTVTQPLLSEISRTQANRQKFSDGVVRFFNKYGFDGLDIDWEYPGAPDRGGKPEDTENFTLLMKTLRSTFNASPRKLGLTFTIPSSFGIYGGLTCRGC